MWRIPTSLIAGASETDITVNANTLIGNLWTFLGSPVGAQTVIVTVDGVDIGDVQITADWNGASTFQFTCINGGRILGLGGNGGSGGNDFGASGSAGNHGTDGGPSISCDGFTINVNIDDGFLCGGGGGGGGGGYDDQLTFGHPGGGGGGGQGFSVTAGGAAGSPTGIPAANPGVAGGQAAPGGGGAGGGTIAADNANDGGTGGEWGRGGLIGLYTNPAVVTLRGGNGGRAGQAFKPTNAAGIVYNGLKTEATLRAEARLRGETEGYVELLTTFSHNVFGATIRTLGFTFLANVGGDFRFVNSQTGNVDRTDAWFLEENPTLANYEVSDIVGTRSGTWDAAPAGLEGTWRALTADRTWTITDNVAQTVNQAFYIRRVGDAGVLDSGFYQAVMEGP